MQFMEDYSEPQPSVFYQTPQSESIYEQRNRLIQEVYGFNDSFSSSDSVHEPLPPPALPPKQRQLVSSIWCTHSLSFSFPLTGTRCHTDHANIPHVVHTSTPHTSNRALRLRRKCTWVLMSLYYYPVADRINVDGDDTARVRFILTEWKYLKVPVKCLKLVALFDMFIQFPLKQEVREG